MFREVTRLWPVWLVTVALMAIVASIAPQQIGIVAYKGCLIGLGGLGGYWLDRWTFPPIREQHSKVEQRAAMQRRALLMAAAMLASGLGA